MLRAESIKQHCSYRRRQPAASMDRDYLYSWGWFSAIFSGSCQSFGVSPRQILDFILKKAHAKGELWENSAAREQSATKSGLVTPKNEKCRFFTWNIDFETSGHPKISWGPALTRNVKTIWLVETGFAKTRPSKAILLLPPAANGGQQGPRLYVLFGGVVFGDFIWIL